MTGFKKAGLKNPTSQKVSGFKRRANSGVEMGNIFHVSQKKKRPIESGFLSDSVRDPKSHEGGQ